LKWSRRGVKNDWRLWIGDCGLEIVDWRLWIVDWRFKNLIPYYKNITV
jgi:hypothetical protein